ncbi:transcriptional regulator with XRE-family HTH domain [Kitasatospora sp. MAP12-15]|uniref:telomere-protecting terminal protein Tpg n=1 Tax=unclassified Kitasatospora TaxID=2633591 RepID=UPI0024741D6A|nr:helix-turn-helix transcriptional regulator [Kitasatospora sp. MAP12-44]MDH6107835.1 transcriptional regulator with XRE-family HTH domain [Kitasatospora sp. MAP12-44]
MGEIDEGLERAERTRPIPQSTTARMRFLLKGAKGSTKQLAQELGVSQRTVQRWLKGQGTPRPAAAKTIEKQVRSKWQPRVKARTRKAAEQYGFLLHLQAKFGFSSAAGSTDDPRERLITQKMPGEVARRLYAARDAGASQAQQEALLAQALQEHYFKDNGRRAAGLTTELNDIGWLDIEL